MCHEQQSRPRQPLAQPGVVDGRHDRLARPCGGDQQVPVMSPLPRQFDLLDQAFLERFRPQLDRAQYECAALVGLLGLGQEDLTVVRHKVAAVPVALEHRRHLVHHIRIAHRRDADVPFEARDLRRVGQVGRSDVGCRESGVTVEEPRLGVQPCSAGVVGDADLRTEFLELVERAGFGGVRVGCGQDPQRTARSTMRAQCLHQRGDAASPDKGHDHVDPIGGVEFRQNLAPDARFPRGVSQESRI